jgi:hypothetical protein
MNRFAVVCLALAAAACAGGARQSASSRAELEKWVGKREGALIDELGEPNSSITALSGVTYDVYREGDTSGVKITGCETTFLVNSEGVVYNVAWKGEGCADAEPKPVK